MKRNEITNYYWNKKKCGCKHVIDDVIQKRKMLFFSFRSIDKTALPNSK